MLFDGPVVYSLLGGKEGKLKHAMFMKKAVDFDKFYYSGIAWYFVDKEKNG